MPFVTSVHRALPVALLFATLASAASCWYPDGTTQASDIPCDTSAEYSSCCSSQSFCLSGGLCLTGGVVTRGSCTDKTWGSEACAGFCKDVDKNGEVAITPCSAGLSTNTFVCGLDNGKCDSNDDTFTLPSSTQLILRPAQIQALVGPALASGISEVSSSATATLDSGDGLYPASALVGTALGVGLPLLMAFGVVLYLLIREKRKPAGPTRNSMYKTPDDDEDKGSIMIGPAPSMFKRATSRMSYESKWSGRIKSEIGSIREARTVSPKALYSPNPNLQKPASIHSPVQSVAESQRASHIPSFAERVETLKVTPQLVQVRDSGSSRHELDSAPTTPLQQPTRTWSSEKVPTSPADSGRFELPVFRMSR